MTRKVAKRLVKDAKTANITNAKFNNVNVRNGRLAPPDTHSITSVSSIKSTTSTTSITTHKRTSFVAVSQEVSVPSGTQKRHASRRPDDGSINIVSVSQSESVTIKDGEITTTENVIETRTDQAESIHIADAEGTSGVNEEMLNKLINIQGIKSSELNAPGNGIYERELMSLENTIKNVVALNDPTKSKTLKTTARIDFGEASKHLFHSDEWLYYIHNWDEKSSESSEMVASVNEMEIILTRELVRKFRNYNSDSSFASFFPIFFHDHENGHALVEVDKDFYIAPNRQDLLRVIGCGHFLLSYLANTFSSVIEECSKEENLDWAISFLTSVKSEWERSVLDKQARCDEAVGIGNHFNDLASRWLVLNMEHRSDGELQRWLDLNAAKFMCKTMCFSAHQQDLASTNQSAYKEFLFLHMACIAEHDEPNNTDPQLLKQFMLLNRKFHAQVLTIPVIDNTIVSHQNRQQRSEQDVKDSFSTDSHIIKVPTETHGMASRPKGQGETTKRDSACVTDGAGETTLVENTGIRNSIPAAAFTRDAVQDTDPSNPIKTPLFQGGKVTNMQLWQPSDPFKATDWFKTSDGKAMKVIEQHWKLGCKGCPEGLQQIPSKGEKSQRQRKCKWVTIKRTVLAKRPISKESKSDGAAADQRGGRL